MGVENGGLLLSSAMSGTDTVDLQTAADQLGVHYQTAYGWVRQGRLRAELVGGRYLVHTDEIDRFAAERRQPRRPAPPSERRVERQAVAFAEALRAGDEVAARVVCQKLTTDGLGVIELIQSVISPALVDIGQAWRDGQIEVWVEHRASAITERALSDVAPNPRGRRRGTAAVAAITGDHHVLPTIMATAALRSGNWRVHHLGANTPPESIHAFVRDHDIDLMVLSNTNPDVADATDRTADALRGDGVRVMVGRPGASLHDLLEEAAAPERAVG